LKIGEVKSMEENEALKKVLDDYIEAFEARDLERCLAFFHEDAHLQFATGHFPGIKQIEQWHKDRFKGGMRLVEIEDMEFQGNTLIVHAVVTSPRLKLVRIKDLRGTGTFVIEEGKFKEYRMELRKGYRFHI
jgi:hypothetical protein